MKRLSVPLIALGVLGLTACQQTVLTSSTPTTSVIDRANEMQNLLNFDSCLSNGLEQDAQAAASDERGQYLASAKTLSSWAPRKQHAWDEGSGLPLRHASASQICSGGMRSHWPPTCRHGPSPP